MNASASLYVRGTLSFVTSESRTEAGFWIEHDPYFVCEDVDSQVLAAQVIEALDASKTGVPTPPRDSLGSRLPELAGVKSFGAFMRGTVSVDVSRDVDGITVIPMRNAGARGGFEFLNDLSCLIDSPASLAQALDKALEQAE